MDDKIIIGAGLYGLYAALYCARKNQKVTVLEIEKAAFTRATYNNQARVHMGYHYPRSLSTAMKSAGYFRRFVEDFRFCIHDSFQQIYATSSRFSWTDAAEFRKFCLDAGIPCLELPVGRYFQTGQCDGAFLTEEYTYDAGLLRDYFVEELKKFPNVEIKYSRDIQRIVKESDCYRISALYQEREEEYCAPFVLNASYASVNQVLGKVEGVPVQEFDLKYELCEIILCRVDEALKNIGLTVMDGPFFSIMPFGKTGYHSLTSVTFTPHKTSYQSTPRFSCAETGKSAEQGACTAAGTCGKQWLANCNDCPARPESAWEYMSALARKYILEDYGFTYEKSLFSMKPILKSSEIDDSRPTVIRVIPNEDGLEKPVFLSVLSGKINTVYDMDAFLD